MTNTQRSLTDQEEHWLDLYRQRVRRNGYLLASVIALLPLAIWNRNAHQADPAWHYPHIFERVLYDYVKEYGDVVLVTSAKAGFETAGSIPMCNLDADDPDFPKGYVSARNLPFLHSYLQERIPGYWSYETSVFGFDLTPNGVMWLAYWLPAAVLCIVLQNARQMASLRRAMVNARTDHPVARSVLDSIAFMPMAAPRSNTWNARVLLLCLGLLGMSLYALNQAMYSPMPVVSAILHVSPLGPPTGLELGTFAPARWFSCSTFENPAVFGAFDVGITVAIAIALWERHGPVAKVV